MAYSPFTFTPKKTILPFLGDRQVYTTHVSYIFDMLAVFKLTEFTTTGKTVVG